MIEYSLFNSKMINRLVIVLVIGVLHLQSLTAQQIRNFTLRDGLPQSQVNDIVQDNEGFLWIATNGGGVCRFDGEEFELKNDSLINLKAIKFLVRAGRIEVKTEDGTIVDFAGARSNESDRIDTANESDLEVPFISNVSVKRIIGDQLYVGTFLSGIIVIDIKSQKILERITREDGLLSNDIRSIFEDRQGTVWIGTASGGLSRYRRSGFEHFDQSNGFGSNEINSVLAKDSSTYVANGRSGIYKIKNDQITKLATLGLDGWTKYHSLAIDQYDRIWAASENNGLLIFDSSSSAQFNTDNGLISNQVQKIIYDDRSMWIASEADGIQHIRIDSAYATYGTLQHYSGEEGIQDLFIKDILLTDDRLLYATQEGSIGWIKDGQVSHFNKVIGESISIDVLAHDRGQLYIGTAGRGVWSANISDDLIFTRVDIGYELGADRINQLVIGHDDALWIGHGKGLDLIILDDQLKIKNAVAYGYNDGFIGIETSPRSATIDNNGRLWFGTVNGLTKYESSQSKLNYTKPELTIDAIEVDYQPIFNHNEFSVNNNKRLKLNPDQNNLSISFRSIDLLHPNDVEYRWKVNFADWSPWNRQPRVTLANMEHGRYHFQVQSRNHSGYRSEGRSFFFEITAPLWQQSWFQAASVFGLLFLSFGLLVRYINRVNRKASAAQQKLKEENHLLSLEQKALQLQMNPHFIFNVLHNIKALSLSEPKKSRQIINEFAVLLRSILENSRAKTISLDTEIQTLKHYLKVEQHMSAKPFEYNLSIDEMIPPMLIQPFVENAIHHGIAAVNRDGKVDIDFKLIGRYLNCAITDNGIGIEESKKKKTSKSHNSVALDVTKDRINSLDRTQSVRLEQLVDAEGIILGTKVEFKIPHVMDF